MKSSKMFTNHSSSFLEKNRRAISQRKEAFQQTVFIKRLIRCVYAKALDHILSISLQISVDNGWVGENTRLRDIAVSI